MRSFDDAGSARNPAVIRHQGMVIAMAHDDAGDIYYRALATDLSEPDDDKHWSGRRKLVFPKQLRPAGISLLTVDHDALPPTKASSPATVDFQVVSDNRHVYVFRQSPNATLYVDRFVLDAETCTLTGSVEARFRRSQKRDLPAGRKDSLGTQNMERQFFIEPTIELALEQGVHGGRFTVCIVPATPPQPQRWQLFTVDAQGAAVTATSIQRAEDGLFDLNHVDTFSFSLEGLKLHGAPAALLYHQQEHATDQYGRERLLKREARLLFAALAEPQSGPKRMAVLDLGVTPEGAPQAPGANITLAALAGADGKKIAPPLLAPDVLEKHGLAITGGLLTFEDAGGVPTLFESVDGLLRLYFQGAPAAGADAGALHAAQFEPIVARASFVLALDDEAGGPRLRFTARRPGAFMNTATLQIVADAGGQTCTLTIEREASAGVAAMREVWPGLPPDAARLVRVLSGLFTTDANDPRVASGELEHYPSANQVEVSGFPALTSEERPVPPLCVLFGASVENMPEDGAVSLPLQGSDALSASREHEGRDGAWIPEPPGRALKLDSADDAVPLENKLPTIAGDLTLEAWVRPATPTGSATRRIISCGRENAFSLGLVESAGGARLFAQAGGRTLVSEASVEAGEWTHVAASYDATAAVSLDGDPDTYVDAGKAAEFNTGAALAVEGWVRPLRHDGERAIVAKWGEEAAERSWMLGLNAAGNPFLRVRSDAGTLIEAQADVTVPTGADTHLAGVFDAEPRDTWAMFTQGTIGGADSYGIVPRREELNFKRGDNLTVEFWVKVGNQTLENGRTDLTLMEQWNDEVTPKPGYPYAIRYLADKGLVEVTRRGLLPSGDTITIGRDSTTRIDDGLFHHIAFVVDGGQFILYVDGIEEARADDVPENANIQNGIEPHLGIRGGGHNALQGWFNNARIWKVARSAAEIRANMRELGVRREGLLGYWPLNQKDAAGKVSGGVLGDMEVRGGAEMKTVDMCTYRARIYVNGVLGGKADNKPNDKGLRSGEVALPRETAVAKSGAPVLIGRAEASTGLKPFAGQVDNVRVWGAERMRWAIVQYQDAIASENNAGLLADWRFDEARGRIAFDAKGGHHARLMHREEEKIPDMWVATTRGAALTLYVNSVSVKTSPSTAIAQPGGDQLTLGGRMNGSTAAEVFAGLLDEVRVWRVVRTAEQLEDNMHRPIDVREDGIVGYWAFGPAQQAGRDIEDLSIFGSHAALAEGARAGAFDETAEAPVGNEAPQVLLAYRGTPRTYNVTIVGRAGVAEYGDMQRDAEGNLMAVMKRAYVFAPAAGKLTLLVGYKAGDLEQEFVSQIQTAPTLIGYIEGAPPVPSENLTLGEEEADTYRGASSVQLTEARESVHVFGASREDTENHSRDLQTGFTAEVEVMAGVGVAAKTVGVNVKVGYHGAFETSNGWSADAGVSSATALTMTKSLELTGGWEEPQAIVDGEPVYFNSSIGRRYVPRNVGYALVKSGTADLFALRHRQSGALVAYQALPNPDIPEDWNIITFPINPAYVRNGSLDGRVGFMKDPATGEGNSYFNPVEAYALKEQIERQNKRLAGYYSASNLSANRTLASTLGVNAALPDTQFDFAAGKMKRSMVNTYVWTADGGFYAEEEEYSVTRSESFGSSYSMTDMHGVLTDVSVTVAGVGGFFASDTLWGSSMSVTATQAKEETAAFGLSVSVAGESFLDRIGEDRKALRVPGKVDAYRFMTFYLAPERDNFDTFFDAVVDPNWLNRSGAYEGVFDPSAAAMKQAMSRKNEVWRVMHRVTYVSRVPQQFAATADETVAPDVRKPHNTISNALIIRLVEEELAKSVGVSGPAALAKVGDVVDGLLTPPAPGQAIPIAGYVPWWSSIRAQPRNDKDTSANQRDLRTDILTYLKSYFAIDPSSRDTQMVLPEITIEAPVLGAAPLVPLKGLIVNNGRGGRSPVGLDFRWSLLRGPVAGEALFVDAQALETDVAFTEVGEYVLQLAARNEAGEAIATTRLTIPGRARRDLLALYTFDGDGTAVRDLAAFAEPLDLSPAPTNGSIEVVRGGVVTLAERAAFVSSRPAGRIAEFVKTSHALTVEAWITPAAAEQPSLARIVTISGGPGERNLTLGQRGGRFHVALRADANDPNASRHGLAGGAVTAGALTHVVFTRASDGRAALYVDGQPVAERMIGGSLAAWDPNHLLSLGDEVASDDGIDRAWAGDFHLVAIYGRALDVDQVRRNHAHGLADGADSDMPPAVTIEAPAETTVAKGATITARVADDSADPSAITGAWGWSEEPAAPTVADAAALSTAVTFSGAGVYTLWRTAGDGTHTGVAAARIAVHDKPQVTLAVTGAGVEAVGDRFVVTRGAAQENVTVNLESTLVSDGLAAPRAGAVTYEWRTVSEPAGKPLPSNPTAPRTPLRLAESGRYRVELTVSNGHDARTVPVTIEVKATPSIAFPTIAPVVMGADAADVTLEQPIQVSTGLGINSTEAVAVTPAWSGPAPVRSSANGTHITATFTKVGRYQLTATVSNGALSATASAEVVVHRLPAIDIAVPPVVQARRPAMLDAVVSDDGLPGAALALGWSASPAGVVFGDARASYTGATFPAAGEYTVTLTADDGVRPATSASVKVTVLPPPRSTGEAALFRLDRAAVDAGRVANGAANKPANELRITNGAATADGAGLVLSGTTRVASEMAASALVDAVRQSKAITIEAWVRPAVARLLNPAETRTIVTISQKVDNRNITLAQQSDGYRVRARTAANDPAGSNGTVSVAGAIAAGADSRPSLAHVVYTLDTARGDKKPKLYVNGKDVTPASGVPAIAALDGWSTDFKLAIGSEPDGTEQWQGEVYLVAIYDRSLTAQEVQNNFDARF